VFSKLRGRRQFALMLKMFKLVSSNKKRFEVVVNRHARDQRNPTFETNSTTQI